MGKIISLLGDNSIAAIIGGVFGLVGCVGGLVVAYIGIYQNTEPIKLIIQATQTAEARVTAEAKLTVEAQFSLTPTLESVKSTDTHAITPTLVAPTATAMAESPNIPTVPPTNTPISPTPTSSPPSPTSTSSPPLPTSTPVPPSPTPTPPFSADIVWHGEYFNNQDFLGPPTYKREDIGIDFYWGAANPAPGIGQDHFSIRWMSCINFDERSYDFVGKSDDTIRAWIDDTELFHYIGSTNQELFVSAGSHCVKFEYKHRSGKESHVSFDIVPN